MYDVKNLKKSQLQITILQQQYLFEHIQNSRRRRRTFMKNDKIKGKYKTLILMQDFILLPPLILDYVFYFF